MIKQDFGDQSMSRTGVYQWHARFKKGRTSIDDDEHTGRPTSCTTPETVARIQELVRHDRRRTIRDIAEDVVIDYGTWQWVLAAGIQNIPDWCRHLYSSVVARSTGRW
jgi:transposase